MPKKRIKVIRTVTHKNGEGKVTFKKVTKETTIIEEEEEKKKKKKKKKKKG